MHVLLLAVLAALLLSCGSAEGPRAYKAFSLQHLQDLELINRDGSLRAVPGFEPDYSNLPDFAAITDIKTRKQAFFDYLRPAVEFRNALNRERALLLQATAIRFEYDMPLSDTDQAFLDAMRVRYRVPEELSDREAQDLLQRRLGPIPESMVLAQAAIESGWGTSRFAREANNLFGQWCWDAGCGVTPDRRRKGATHEVARFDTVVDAIASYFRNINTHPAYRGVRDIRLEAETKQEDLSGTALAAGLGRYSERGDIYIDEVRTVIRINHLE